MTTELTKRELTILELCDKGLQFSEIAGIIQCKPSSVKSGIREIYNKLGASNRDEAVAISHVRGILSGGMANACIEVSKG